MVVQQRWELAMVAEIGSMATGFITGVVVVVVAICLVSRV